MTILNHVVNSAIYNYPTLYRNVDYEKSRLLVLNHLFFVIGNGYEWHKDGYLYTNRKPRKTLPKGFFEKKLFDMEYNLELVKEMKEEFKGRFFYIRNDSVVFEAKDEEALLLSKKFGSERSRNFPFVLEASAIGRFEKFLDYDYEPYPLSEYSGLVEILNGRAYNRNFDLVPLSDWIEGCLDIARHALDYYEDESKFSKNHYHHSKSIKQYRRQSEKWLEQIKVGETLEQFAERMWEKYRKEQLDYINKFIDKFGKFFDDGVLTGLMGAQKSPSSVSKIQAENKFVKKELERIDNNVD